jgi:hypothetical protein
MPTVEELELLKKSAVVEIQTDLIAAVATDTAAAVAAKDAAETAETNAGSSETAAASSASASATSASEAAASAASMPPFDLAGAIAGDAIVYDGTNWIAQDIAITDLQFTVKLWQGLTSLPSVFLQLNGTILTGNGTTADFTDPIDGRLFKKLTDLTAGVPQATEINISGLNTQGEFGIILGIDDDNYFEFVWGRQIRQARRIIAGSVDSTLSESGSIAVREMPYKLKVTNGGLGTRSTFSFFFQDEINREFKFTTTNGNYTEDLTFIAVHNLLSNSSENIAINSNKFS